MKLITSIYQSTYRYWLWKLQQVCNPCRWNSNQTQI